MDLTYISMEKKDRVAIAWLNKPKANTYDADLMRDLNTMIDDVRFDDDVDVCVIASKLDGVWSAGADINLLASSTPDYKAMFCLNCQEILNKMESTPKLFIAAIDGHCVGGGLEIAMATDLRVASDGAWRVGLPEVTLGVLPRTGGTQRLARVPREAKASLRREVTFGIAAGDVGPEGRVEHIGSGEPRIRVARVADLDALAQMWEKLENYHADLGGPEYRLAPGWKGDWRRFTRGPH